MKHKILVIDDSLTLRQFAKKLLAQHSPDSEILLAKDGSEGVALASSELPDIILLDYILPDFNGDEVCQKLLDQPSTSGIPVILMSSNVVEITRTEFQHTNVIKSLTKPFTGELLGACVGHARREAEAKRLAAEEKSQAALRSQSSPGAAGTTAATPKPQSAKAWFHAPAALVPFDTVLPVLLAEGFTGVLQWDLPAERVLLIVSNHEVVGITSNDPRSYCIGASYNFRGLPSVEISNAVVAQQKQHTPFFITLVRAGMMERGPELDALLRSQGESALVRAVNHPEAVCRFTFTPRAPEFAREFPVSFSPLQLRLAVYRKVTDPGKMEKSVPTLDAVPACLPGFSEAILRVELLPQEKSFAELVDGKRSLRQIAGDGGLHIEEVSHICFRFVKLELMVFTRLPV